MCVCVGGGGGGGGGGVIMRDFKIRMDGLVKETTGFRAPRPTKKMARCEKNLELFSGGNRPSCDPTPN